MVARAEEGGVLHRVLRHPPLRAEADLYKGRSTSLRIIWRHIGIIWRHIGPNFKMDNEQYQARLRHEYDRSIDLLKHFATVQFAQLSIFVALMSGAFLYFYGNTPPRESVLAFGKLATATVTLLFWIMQESHQYIIGHYLKRCGRLEQELGYEGLRMLPGMPQYKYRPARWAMRLFYCLVLLAWVASYAAGF